MGCSLTDRTAPFEKNSFLLTLTVNCVIIRIELTGFFIGDYYEQPLR